MMRFYLSGLRQRLVRRVRSASKTEWIWLGVFVFHLALTFVLSFGTHEMPDESGYTNLATNIAEHGRLEADTEMFFTPKNSPMAHYGPVWPALLAVPWFFGLGEKGFFLVLALIWCVNAWLIGKCAEELGISGRLRWVAIAWLTCDPIYGYYHGHLMTEPLSIGVALALLLTGFRFLHHPSWNTVGPFALVSGLAHLTRGQLILLSTAIWIVVVLTMSARRWPRYIAAFAVVHMLVIMPWLMRMDSIGAGGMFPERKLGYNLYLFNTAEVRNPYSLQPGESVHFPDGLSELTPRDRDEKLVSLALQSIAKHKLLYVKRCLYRLGYLISPIAVFTNVTKLQDWGLAIATLLFFYSLWIAVFVEGVRAKRWGRNETTLLLAVLLWYLFHILVNASVRNRIPSDAWLALLALSLISERASKGASANLDPASKLM